jgi:prepilin-type N-terminal cleavage/methylation domain-containing protein
MKRTSGRFSFPALSPNDARHLIGPGPSRRGTTESTLTAAAGQGGFTLVENIVSLIIVGIVLAAIAAVLVFGNNMMAHQKAVTNAQTLASTIKTSVEGTLRNAKGMPDFSDGAITFTNDKKTNYLAKGDYTLSIRKDDATAQGGYVNIAKGSGANAADTAGDLVPKSTYIDGDTVKWEVNSDNPNHPTLTLTVYSQTNENLATTEISLEGDDS